MATAGSETRGPLAGIRVLDFSTLLPGPLATLLLAEAGAEVVKIERPDGEDMRRFQPLWGDGKRQLRPAQPRQEKRGGRPEGRPRARPHSRVGQDRRRGGGAVPPRRHGPVRARLCGLSRRQCAHRLLRHHRLRPERPALGPRRPRPQLHRRCRPAGAVVGAAGPPRGAAGADRRHRRRGLPGGDEYPAGAAPARGERARARSSTSAWRKACSPSCSGRSAPDLPPANGPATAPTCSPAARRATGCTRRATARWRRSRPSSSGSGCHFGRHRA